MFQGLNRIQLTENIAGSAVTDYATWAKPLHLSKPLYPYLLKGDHFLLDNLQVQNPAISKRWQSTYYNVGSIINSLRNVEDSHTFFSNNIIVVNRQLFLYNLPQTVLYLLTLWISGKINYMMLSTSHENHQYVEILPLRYCGICRENMDI